MPELQARPQGVDVSRNPLFRQLALGITAPIVLVFALIPHAQAAVAEYAIDPAHTVVTFETRNLGFLKYRGTFNDASGTVQLDPAGGGRVEILVDARSLTAANAAMAQFLRGESLLDVERHPRIAYTARRIAFVAGAPERIEGELTLLGVTRPVTLAITGNDCVEHRSGAVRERCTMAATATFRRSDFGMSAYRAFASDEVRLIVNAAGVRVAN